MDKLDKEEEKGKQEHLQRFLSTSLDKVDSRDPDEPNMDSIGRPKFNHGTFYIALGLQVLCNFTGTRTSESEDMEEKLKALKEEQERRLESLKAAFLAQELAMRESFEREASRVIANQTKNSSRNSDRDENSRPTSGSTNRTLVYQDISEQTRYSFSNLKK